MRKNGLKVTAIDPTEDHPLFGQAKQAMRVGDKQSRDQILTRLLPRSQVDALALVGIDAEKIIHNGQISWHEATAAADEIERNLPQLGSTETLRKWWLRIAEEWRFSGGLRLSGSEINYHRTFYETT